ncbi:DHS-like NAD/FAD-binding domain-containing protein [Lineolata rhizophorae]|uniref:DHS-like NAD/FAD-binding domain-containing protein n=1 Tax=Lineolata rhizophorae TaxID=578093 RepID=A0A6A6PA27_9PEZI|nr:DHS-like NAD/FAD-binding domain-containing protein [Lineolata rhizophorae]
MEADACSNVSSGLSSPPTRSPSPPPDYYYRDPDRPYPSPSSQQSSATATPAPENAGLSASQRSTATAMADDASATNAGDSQPPKKRRRVAEPRPRITEYLDLSAGEVKQDQEQSLNRLLKVLHGKKKIVVIAGAGISVSAGIPDFRSSNGLFNNLKRQHNLKGSGQDLFNVSVYSNDKTTSTFHAMVRELSESTKNAEPTAFHRLLDTLASEKRLLRLYSQNVDCIDTRTKNLSTRVPLGNKGPWPNVVQLHGALSHSVCTKCKRVEDFQPDIFDGPNPPACPHCEKDDQVRTEFAGKRSHGIGRLRPRMVLYDESSPDDEAIGSVTRADLRARPDAFLVVGTSLKIPGVKRIAREMCKVVRGRRDGVTVWINNDPEPASIKDLEWDIVVRGPCDEVANRAAMIDPEVINSWSEKEWEKEKLRRQKAAETTAVEVPIATPKKSRTVERVAAGMLTPSASTPEGSPRLPPQLPLEVGESRDGNSEGLDTASNTDGAANATTTKVKLQASKKKRKSAPADLNGATKSTAGPAPKPKPARANSQRKASARPKKANNKPTTAAAAAAAAVAAAESGTPGGSKITSSFRQAKPKLPSSSLVKGESKPADGKEAASSKMAAGGNGNSNDNGGKPALLPPLSKSAHDFRHWCPPGLPQVQMPSSTLKPVPPQEARNNASPLQPGTEAAIALTAEDELVKMKAELPASPTVSEASSQSVEARPRSRDQATVSPPRSKVPVNMQRLMHFEERPGTDMAR